MMSLRSMSIMEWWVTFDRGSYPAKYWYVAFTPNACEPSNTATSGRVRVLERVFISVMTVVVCSCGVEKVGFRLVRWRRVCVCAPRCERVRSTKPPTLGVSDIFWRVSSPNRQVLKKQNRCKNSFFCFLSFTCGTTGRFSQTFTMFCTNSSSPGGKYRLPSRQDVCQTRANGRRHTTGTWRFF